MLKTYLQYLLAKPGKMAWIIGVNLALALIGYAFFSDIGNILGDNPVWLIVMVCIILTIIRIAVDLHPFIEWKDGKDRN
jgi:hypothetical protein